MRQKWDKLFNKIYTVTVQGVETTRTTVRLPVGTKKNIPSNFDVIGTLGRYIISCWVLRAACFYTYSNEVMYAQQFSMMMNKMNQSRRENVKVDIKLEKCISTSNPTFLTTAVHSICAYLSFCLWGSRAHCIAFAVILTSVTEINVISIGLAPYLWLIRYRPSKKEA